jgi:hypothetical protein
VIFTATKSSNDLTKLWNCHLCNARVYLLEVFSRSLSRCDPCAFCPPLLYSFCTRALASVAFPAERDSARARVGARDASLQCRMWLKNVSAF